MATYSIRELFENCGILRFYWFADWRVELFRFFIEFSTFWNHFRGLFQQDFMFEYFFNQVNSSSSLSHFPKHQIVPTLAINKQPPPRSLKNSFSQKFKLIHIYIGIVLFCKLKILVCFNYCLQIKLRK